MPEDTTPIADADPLTIEQGTTDAGQTYARFEATLHPSGEATAPELTHERFLFDNADEHVHPNQAEVVEPLSGPCQVAYDGEERRIPEGESVTLPAATPHRHWNPTDGVVRVAFEQRPARRSAALVETLYTLAQVGQTDESGLPNLLHLAVLADEYPGHFYSADLPLGLQRAVLPLVAPIGRWLGYEAERTRADVWEST